MLVLQILHLFGAVRPDEQETMRTQLMLNQAAGMPWLERDAADGGPPEQTPLPSFPFTLGRSESADLTIDSSRVSREHVRIYREGDKYRVRDLGSTNGTFLNGQRIDESPLEDGDILVLADIEFTFFLGRSEPTDRAVTQVMSAGRPKEEKAESPVDLISEIRRLHETILLRSVQVRFAPIVRLDDQTVFGGELANATDHLRSETERAIWEIECRAVFRLRYLERLVAAEEARAFAPNAHLFLRLDSSEIGSSGLAESLGQLTQVLNEEQRLVVELPDSAVSDTPYYRELRDHLRGLGIGIAHGDFASGPAQLLQQEAIAPDYVTLAKTLARAIHRAKERQRQVESIVEAAMDIGCEVIATGIRTEEEAEVCRKLGCQFGRGELFGSMESTGQTASGRLVSAAR